MWTQIACYFVITLHVDPPERIFTPNMHIRQGFAAAAFGLACFALPGYAGVISTLGSWNGSSYIGTFGTVSSAETPTYGETFTAVAGDDVLQSMQFEIETLGTAAIPYSASVYAWTGTAVSGAALFTSSVGSIATAPGFQAISASVPNLSLTDGDIYIALFSTLGDGGSSSGYAAWGGQLPDITYTGGTFEYNNGSTLASLATSTWNDQGNFGDLAFALNFAPAVTTPEPSTLILVGGALLGLARLRRRAARS